jgi:hypothetical protein
MATIITNKPHKVAWIDFVNQTGATDRKPLLDFVTGCFDLGIWDNMVCWPMRSAQNAGSGTVVHSLGGLGTFNGNMVNSPTWGADGVNFNASGARIEVPLSLSQPITGLCAANFKALQTAGTIFDGTVNRVVCWNGGGSNGRIDTFAGSSIAHTSPEFSTGWNWAGVQADGANSAAILNANSTAGNAGSNSLGPTVHVGNNFVANDNGKSLDLAFFCLLNTTYADSIRTLYKTTLGQGLGLP